MIGVGEGKADVIFNDRRLLFEPDGLMALAQQFTTGGKTGSPGIARLEFSFAGETADGEPVAYRGIEHIIARDGRIEHIDVERIADPR